MSSPVAPRALEGRVALVTGGSEGLGRAIAEAFLAEGATVVITGRSVDKGEAAVAEIGLGDALRFVAADATTLEGAVHPVDHCLSELGRIDVLVNNVGGSAGFARVHELTDEAWDRSMVLNLKSAFWATRQALPAMLSQQRGRIINMSSVEGKQATMAAVSHYVTAKHALHGFTKAVALEYGPSGITCNAICPGAVPTKSTPTGEAAAAAAGISHAEFVEHYIEGTKTKQLNAPEQVAGVALLLAGDLGSGITGALWSVDGGTSSW